MKQNRLLRLFLTTLYISACTFGGGFVIVTFMKRKFVDEAGWISDAEMLDLTALAQSAPGAIAVNAAILVGWKVAGLPGMLLAVLGTLIPPVGIISVIALFYQAFAANRYVALFLQGMQASVAAVLLDVVCSLSRSVLAKPSPSNYVIMLGAFAASFVFRVNVAWIILAAAAIGILRTLCIAREKGGRA